MKPNLKKMLALILALMLSLPAFTLAEDDAALSAPEIVVEAPEASETLDGATASETAEGNDGEVDLELEGDDALELADESVDLSIDLDGLDATLVEGDGAPTDPAADPAQANDAANPTEGAHKDVFYVDARDWVMGTKDCILLDGKINNLTSGWYSFNADYVYYPDGLNIVGDVNLIVPDNEKLHVKEGIHVPEHGSLTIWTQSHGKNMGHLQADTGYHKAGIGGVYGEIAGPIVINGGNIYSQTDQGHYTKSIGASSGTDSGFTRIEINAGRINVPKGIGAGRYNERIGDIVITGGEVITNVDADDHGEYDSLSGNNITISGDESRGDFLTAYYNIHGNNITINSGKVEAHGSSGAIGPLVDDKPFTVTINGGHVFAKGNDGSAGIGSTAFHDMKGSITINGGVVEATCQYDAATIGGGYRGDMDGTITITGGTVTAMGKKSSGTKCGTGIGAGYEGDFEGKVVITGGTVTAVSDQGGAGIGAGWAGNAKKGTVTISGGTVVAIGSGGAAGIGGGREGDKGTGGEGGKVYISGRADVTAISGAYGDKTHCSAIGHGHDDKVIGEVYIDGELMVRAGDNQAKAEEAGPVPQNQRDGMCMYRNYAHVQPCEHSRTGYDFDKNGHRRKPCAWCGRTWEREPHAFLDSEKCIQCGYVRPFISVTFDANGGKGDMDVQKFFNGKAQSLKANRFTWKDHTFRCWNTRRDGSGTPYADMAEINPKANITLYAQWYTNVTLMGTTTRAEWTGKPITGSGYKVIMPDRTIDTRPVFRGVSARRTETEVGKYQVEFKGVKLNKTRDTTGTLLVTKIENGWLIIDKARPTVEKPKGRSLTYNSKEQALVRKGKTDGGTMMYSLDKRSWSKRLPTARNAGTYTVWYKVVGDERHEDMAPRSVKATIAKKKITVTADPMAKYLGDPDPELTYTVDGLIKGDKLTGHLTREKGEAWGGYRIKLGTLSAGDNYAITFVSSIFIIQRTSRPTAKPTTKPTTRPSTKPTTKPTTRPSTRPTTKPTTKPTVTAGPTVTPESRSDDSDFTLLAVLKASGSDDTALELSWTLVAGADGYDIYYAKYDSDTFKPYRSVGAISGRIQLTGLAEHTAYKACVRAWKETDGHAFYIGDTSPVVFAITGGYNDNFCNPRSVTLDRTSVTLSKGETHRIKGSVKGVRSDREIPNYTNDLRYFSSDTSVATVSDSGKIRARGFGKCTIYVIAVNGVRASIKVKVK